MKRIYTYGAWDLIHPGHIKLLEKARALGDYLIVGVVDDNAIKNLKGENRPIQTQSDRAYVIESIIHVDEVILQEGYDPTINLEKFEAEGKHIDILAKGDDWDYIPGTETIEKLGGILVKLKYTKGFSTSSIVTKLKVN